MLTQKDVTQSGWAVAPQQNQPHSAYFIASAPDGRFAASLVTITLGWARIKPQYTLGRFRLSASTSADVVRRVTIPADLLAIIGLPTEKRSDEQAAAKLAAYYRSVAPSLQGVRDSIAALEKSRPPIPTVPVMAELPADKKRTTHVMVKGNFLAPGSVVEPAVPAKFHQLPPGATADRVNVARWLVDSENPLTARVMVNRFWAQLFGTGLVETEEDFGTQGELPTHPALLDWLAVEFHRNRPSGLGTGDWGLATAEKRVAICHLPPFVRGGRGGPSLGT